MRHSLSGPVLISLAAVFVPLFPGTQAATTVLEIELGDTFTGEIETAGLDTVEAHFIAVKGTLVRLNVGALGGSNLKPIVVVTDASGDPLNRGVTLPLLKFGRVFHFFVAPETASYVLVIGGLSGSGEFEAVTKGRPPVTTGTTNLSGTVTNGLTGEGLPDVDVSIGPFSLVTDANGDYSEELPAGQYTATFEAADFITQTQSVTLPHGPASLDVALEPVAPVVVSASLSGDGVPGGTLTGDVTVKILDGSTLQGFLWTQVGGAPAMISGADTANATITLDSAGSYKEMLIHALSEPPVGPDQLPPNVPLPPGEFPGGLQDRFQVVGINPFALEEAGLVTFDLEVVTTSGSYLDEVDAHTELPWKVNPGLRNVPIGAAVLLHGKDQASYNWVLNPPAGSSVALMDATSQNPEFTPDVPGIYEVDVDDEGAGPITMRIYASTWRGVIVGQDVDGRPESDGACLGCHSGFADDKFTPWAQTGHAEIFTDNLDTSTHYGSNCFACHTVGYDPDVANGGADDASDYSDFLNSGLLNNPGDNWTVVLEQFPELARLANIQCENCHGPQGEGLDNDAHGWYEPEGDPRVNLSSDACGTCHGEPLRHARFQQWQLSAHANYELAIEEGDSGNCSRCHTANGFLEWLPILLDDDPATDPTSSISVSWTSDEVHPQTCATCHDPHDIGTTSGIDTNATVRISGDTPPLIAGFTATDVGRGAICMTCHNSRRGLRNDDTFDEFYLTSEAARAPHGSAQTDVLMGQNAYLVEVGVRGAHSFVTDTCIDCHMEQTPPPDVLSYNQGGTNHTFFASADICENCHSIGFRADEIVEAVEGDLEEVQGLVEQAILDLLAEQIALGNTIDLNGAVEITDPLEIKEIVFGETRGRQAIAVTFIDDTTIGLTRMTDIHVLNALSEPIGQLYDFADPSLIKAGWNWNLIHNDGSHGIHNPQFSVKALGAARDALLNDDAPPLQPLGGDLGPERPRSQTRSRLEPRQRR